MKLVLKIKPNRHSKTKRIVAWIQKHSDFDDDILQIFQLFKDNIKISRFSKFLKYYIVTSDNPAIILNIFSTIQEILPEVYFIKEDSIEVEDFIDERELC
ncbi:MAG: hypothetical protein ACFFCY_06640 [Promethearchaeota archaeon]